MSRLIVPAVALLVLGASAPLASAQQRTRPQPQPRQLPLSPGVMPGSPYGPGTQFLPTPGPAVAPPRGFSGGTTFRNPPNAGFTGVGSRFSSGRRAGFGFGYGGFGYGFGGYSGFGGYYDFYGYDPGFAPGYGYVGPSIFPIPVSDPSVPTIKEFPATLTIQLPPAEEMWVGGKPVADVPPKGYVLTSPPIKPGGQYTFDVNVRWTSGGKTYEAKRAVTVNPGDHSRLTIVSGDEVKE